MYCGEDGPSAVKCHPLYAMSARLFDCSISWTPDQIYVVFQPSDDRQTFQVKICTQLPDNFSATTAQRQDNYSEQLEQIQRNARAIPGQLQGNFRTTPAQIQGHSRATSEQLKRNSGATTAKRQGN
jgi:hypothetical protein